MKRVLEFKLFFHTSKGYGNIWLRLEGESKPSELNQIKPDQFAAIRGILNSKDVFFDGTWFSTLENIPEQFKTAPYV